MKNILKEDRTEILIEQLVRLWKKSVEATHLFLSHEEIEEIEKCVPIGLRKIPTLIVEESKNGTPIAFMGIDGSMLEMLFIAPEARRQGLGKKLLSYGIETYSVNKLDVNQQNPQAIGFYEHMGFKAYKQTETDNQGRPYPIVYMKLG